MQLFFLLFKYLSKGGKIAAKQGGTYCKSKIRNKLKQKKGIIKTVENFDCEKKNSDY